jgi:hypothetical protein
MTILALWLPILLSAVAVFIASSIIHMLLGYHNSNYAQIPDEEKFRDRVANLNIPPGEYMVPYAGSSKAMQSESYQQKMNDGPVGMLTMMPNGPFAMGKNLLLWFIYSMIVGLFCAYLATLTLNTNSDYMTVMRIVGTVAFCGYALALVQNSIWTAKSWKTTLKFMFDGLVYALFTGGIFGWLWS